MRLGHGADRSPTSSDEVKNEWGYTSTPQCAFIVQTGTTVPLHFMAITDWTVGSISLEHTDCTDADS
jgi:hypothetical protein